MGRFSVDIDASKVQRAIKRAPERLRVNLRKALQTSGQEFVRAMSGRFGGTPLRSRTGLLKRSITYSVQGSTLNDMALRVVSAGVKYTNLQEYGTQGLPGGVIRPKKPGGFLTIPIDDNLTRAGVQRESARAAIARGAFFLKLRNGRSYIVEREGGAGNPHGNLRFLFRLVKSVRVPPRLGFRSTWDSLRESRGVRVTAAANKSLAEATRG